MILIEIGGHLMVAIFAVAFAAIVWALSWVDRGRK